jgi:prepilin-type N-terminal cleavage/methylation domain-containing protein
MKKGFTLLELIIVIIILGVLASLAVPQYINAVERGRLGEALSLLGLIRSSQMRYYAQFGCYSYDYSGLDADFTRPNYFTTTTSADPAIATVTRLSTPTPPLGVYIMSIDANGIINCSGDDTRDACTKVGYPHP